MGLNKKSFIFGLGAGMIVVGLLFYAAYTGTKPKLNEIAASASMSDADIIEKAKKLGMVSSKDVKKAPTVTAPVATEIPDDVIIKRAEKLGMSFQTEPALESLVNDTNISSETPIPNHTEAVITPTKMPVEPIKTTKPSKSSSSNIVYVTISKGSSALRIATLLYDNGIVKDVNDFSQYLVDKGMTKNVKAGTYLLTKGSSYDSLLSTLGVNKSDVKENETTVSEGAEPTVTINVTASPVTNTPIPSTDSTAETPIPN